MWTNENAVLLSFDVASQIWFNSEVLLGYPGLAAAVVDAILLVRLLNTLLWHHKQQSDDSIWVAGNMI